MEDKYTATEKHEKIKTVQLDMLNEVERICSAYGIKYFADSGTLIGAVREGGYILWDDDIDLVMLRPDYDRFLSIAGNELSAPLVLQTVYTEKNYLRGHAQIRNAKTTGCNAEDEKAGYNCGIFIDIFPLDYMPENRVRQRLWAFSLKTVWSILYSWYRYGYYENATFLGKMIHAIGRVLHIPMQKAFAVYENICRRYEYTDNTWVCSTVFIRQLKKNTWKAEWFKDSIQMKFEDRKIPVPVGFDERLRCEYGDYMKPVREETEHGTLILDPDRPYTEVLKKAEKG